MLIRDLMKVRDHPEVQAAVEAHNQAIAAAEAAWEVWREADRLVADRDAELDAIVDHLINTAPIQNRKD